MERLMVSVPSRAGNLLALPFHANRRKFLPITCIHGQNSTTNSQFGQPTEQLKGARDVGLRGMANLQTRSWVA